jgi:hypothetical protein
VVSLYNRILKTNTKLPLFLLAAVLLEAIYYNIAFDIILIIFLFSTAFALGIFFDVKGRLHSIDKALIRLCLGFGIVGFIIWLTTFHNFNYKSLYFSRFFLFGRSIAHNYSLLKSFRPGNRNSRLIFFQQYNNYVVSDIY